MKWIVALLLLLTVGSITTAQAPNQQRREFLTVLKPKQTILIKEVAGRFTISTLDDDPEALTHKVIEVGTDYVSVEDIAGTQQTRIPIYSITSIVRIKSPKK